MPFGISSYTLVHKWRVFEYVQVDLCLPVRRMGWRLLRLGGVGFCRQTQEYLKRRDARLVKKPAPKNLFAQNQQ